MRYNDTIDDSRQYLRLTLELIGKHGLPTDPLNYCIWYEYASGKNEALNTAIDKHLESSGAFSEEISRQLFNKYVASGKETVTTLVRDELKRIFTEIISAIKTTDHNFSASENHLGSIHQSLVPSLSAADVDRIVIQIKRKPPKTSFAGPMRPCTSPKMQAETR